MAEKKNKSYFFGSYTGIMTSRFFSMLMLFVVAGGQLNKEKKEVIGVNEKLQEMLNKAQEIEDATKGLDEDYFEYKENFKKHKLKIDVYFPKGQSNIVKYVSDETKNKLLEAGKSTKSFIEKTTKKYPGIQYILIIEGQASRDTFAGNYELSYSRALELKRFWEANDIKFTEQNCEVLICGSGDGVQSGTGLMRESDEHLNQRFLIHILPKPGVIKEVRK